MPRTYDHAPDARRLRLALGLTQSEFGQLLGCDRFEITRIEHGSPVSRKTRAALRLLRALADAGDILPID